MTDPRPAGLPEDLDAELDATVEALNDAANRIAPNPAFTARLEQRLASAHAPSEVRSMPLFKKLAPALLFVLAAAVLIVVVDWMIRSLAPQPSPASRNTPAPTSSNPLEPTPTFSPTLEAPRSSYDWNGISLSVNALMPDSPQQGDVYLAQPYVHATLEDVQSLATRFGIQGTVYQAPGELPGTTDYVVADGNQTLRVRSLGYVEYIADVVRAYNNLATVQRPDADQIIASFLEAHGYSFRYRIQWSDWRLGYMVEPLAADGGPMRYEPFSQPMLFFQLNADGTVLRVMTSLLQVSGQPVAQVGLIGADEALQRVLDPARMGGLLEGMHGAAAPMHMWRRTFALDTPLTYYGYVSSMQPLNPADPPYVQLDGYPLSGEIRGLDSLGAGSYIQATGRLVEQHGAVHFNVESWQMSTVQEDGLTGILQRDGDRVIVITDDGTRLTLPDVPADLPMPFEHAFVVGTRTGDTFEWKSVDDRSFSGGGGGGAGLGFFKLNLSGTPVAFPTATAPLPASESGGQYVVQAGDTLGKIASDHGVNLNSLIEANNLADPSKLTIGQVLAIPGSTPARADGLRGMLEVTINKQPDGRQLVSYGFGPMDGGPYVLLEGDNLEPLQNNNSRPVDVWGTINVPADGSIGSLKVERFEIPFPDLKVQVLQGTQRIAEVAGQRMTLFTTDDGQTFVQYLALGAGDPMLLGNEGDQVLLESVAVPGETFGGYPALRLFGGMLAIDPKSGLHVTLPLTRDKPTMLEMPDIGKSAPPDSATIDTVELQYYVSDPRYVPEDLAGTPRHIQPAWRFTGHYSNGDAFEILVQAAQDQYLLPEVEPAVQPG